MDFYGSRSLAGRLPEAEALPVGELRTVQANAEPFDI